jgi:3-oxoacyl-[acyl-carrier-protein] synthase-3
MTSDNLAKINGVKISGISACVPSNIVDNETLTDVYGDDISKVIYTTGVKYRRICREGHTTSLDLCVKAAKRLQEHGNYDFSSFGGIIFLTLSPDYLMPNNASAVQDILGLPKQSAAFDVNMACSGYVYGLWLAGITAKSINKPILLLDGETNSHFASPKDRSTAVLFGDAGTATIIEPSENGSEWNFAFHTDGSQRDALIIPEGGYRNRITPESSVYKKMEDGGVRRGIDMKMDGMGVFNFVVNNVPKNLQILMKNSSTTADDYDVLALHQANLFMVKQIAKSLNFSADKVPTSIEKYGNSSSATIPVTLVSELQDRIESDKLKILASGFGAGLSVASCAFEIGPCVCPRIFDYE